MTFPFKSFILDLGMHACKIMGTDSAEATGNFVPVLTKEQRQPGTFQEPILISEMKVQ